MPDRTCRHEGCDNSLAGMRAHAEFCSASCRAQESARYAQQSATHAPYVGLSFVIQLQREWARASKAHAANR